MIPLKSKREIEIMKRAGDILKQVFAAVKPAVRPGISTEQLDRIAEETILKAGGRPAFKGYRGFPKTACISVNEEVVHGIPGSRQLKDGDIVSFDIGACVDNYYADAARTWPVGDVDQETKRLMDTAKEALRAGLAAYQAGGNNRIGDISAAVQRYVESQGYQVVRDYVGHGIGRAIHEEPQVPNYGNSGRGPKIQPGLVLAIEPMVTEGHYSVKTLEDGWTVVTRDGKRASHHEDSIAFTEDGFINITEGEDS